jgi:hypothetical protein
MRHNIAFDFGEPVLLHLLYAQGKAIDSRWERNSIQYLFTAAEGVFYLSDTAGCSTPACAPAGYPPGSR